MNSVTLTTGAQIAAPFPPPLTLESDNPSVVAVSLDRTGATLKAASAGTAWLTVGLADDFQVKVQVTVQDPSSSPAVMKPATSSPHK